jgi:hypothetical protein
MAAAVVAEVPISIKEIYESDDRNFLLTTAVVVEKVMRLREEAMNQVEKRRG